MYKLKSVRGSTCLSGPAYSSSKAQVRKVGSKVSEVVLSLHEGVLALHRYDPLSILNLEVKNNFFCSVVFQKFLGPSESCVSGRLLFSSRRLDKECLSTCLKLEFAVLEGL